MASRGSGLRVSGALTGHCLLISVLFFELRRGRFRSVKPRMGMTADDGGEAVFGEFLCYHLIHLVSNVSQADNPIASNLRILLDFAENAPDSSHFLLESHIIARLARLVRVERRDPKHDQPVPFIRDVLPYGVLQVRMGVRIPVEVDVASENSFPQLLAEPADEGPEVVIAAVEFMIANDPGIEVCLVQIARHRLDIGVTVEGGA